jgi:CHRD domain
MKRLLLGLGLGILVFAACNSTPALPTYKVTLNGANEIPAVTTAGIGTASATLDGATLSVKIDYSGLSGMPTLAHIHGPAIETASAGVICNFTDKIAAGVSATAGTGTISATCPISATFTVADLDAGKMYVNLHTTANGGGEVRGQLKKQ